jgi:hypothetical protein
VAEVAVRLLRAGQRNRPGSSDRQKIPGPPLQLRLVLAEVRSADGEVLANWRLLTNLPTDVDNSPVRLVSSRILPVHAPKSRPPMKDSELQQRLSHLIGQVAMAAYKHAGM